MARPITIKQIQYHHQCSCGWNSVDHDDLKMKHTDLRKIGGRRRVEKTDNQVWYAVTIKFEGPCDGDHYS